MKVEYFVVERDSDTKGWFKASFSTVVDSLSAATLFKNKHVAMQITATLNDGPQRDRFFTKRVVLSVLTKPEEEL